MGFALAFGACCNCSRQMSFNPMRVPSVRVNGKREPVCEHCMAALNSKRKELGMEPHPIHPDAYEAVDEHELE